MRPTRRVLGLLFIAALLASGIPAGARETILTNFSASAGGFLWPLTSDGQGNLYSVTLGSIGGFGTLFTIRTDGTGFTLLHSFEGTSDNPGEPVGRLAYASDGTLYGACDFGGAYGIGAVYRIRTNGSGFVIVHSFTASDGDTPVRGVSLDNSGNLYGTTVTDGPAGKGTIYRLRTDGSGFTVLHAFAGGASDGAGGASEIVFGDDGFLYGTTPSGTAAGTVYRVRPNGTGYQIVHAFAGGTNDGDTPYSGVTIAGPVLYGTTSKGCAGNLGCIYQVGTDGSAFTILHSFAGGTSDGAEPESHLTELSDGYLYGTSDAGGPANDGVIFRIQTGGASYQILHAFQGGAADGKDPFGPLFADSAGVLHGVTEGGGPGDFRNDLFDPRRWLGVRDRHTRSSAARRSGRTADRRRLREHLRDRCEGWRFGARRCLRPEPRRNDSISPCVRRPSRRRRESPLRAPDARIRRFSLRRHVRGRDGQSGHGLPRADRRHGIPASAQLLLRGKRGESLDRARFRRRRKSLRRSGVRRTDLVSIVYSMTTSGAAFTVLHTFDSAVEGSDPTALFLGPDALLYGAADEGGQYSFGTLFRLSTDGQVFTRLYAFGGGPDGTGPNSLLFVAPNFLVGTTETGGDNGAGVLFASNSDGSQFTPLYAFGADPLGATFPVGDITIDKDLNIFGTTLYGGVTEGGAIWKFSGPTSIYTTLHSFLGGPGDGAFPYGVTLTASGDLLGSCVAGGSGGGGAIFDFLETQDRTSGGQPVTLPGVVAVTGR